LQRTIEEGITLVVNYTPMGVRAIAVDPSAGDKLVSPPDTSTSIVRRSRRCDVVDESDGVAAASALPLGGQDVQVSALEGNHGNGSRARRRSETLDATPELLFLQPGTAPQLIGGDPATIAGAKALPASDSDNGRV
jgi:hypothetical protein